VVLIQVNDVYEIAPVSGGREGGMARVASLKKEFLAKNPNTFLLMAGDFLSPSVFNSLQFEGKSIRGRQMVEAMNAAGTNLAVFGNHEFDIREQELMDRINESAFEWVASNAFHKTAGKVEPFYKKFGRKKDEIQQAFTMEVKDADGTIAKIGFIGITIPSNRQDYVNYTDPLRSAKHIYDSLKNNVDAVIAITHQEIKDDILLAKAIPGLAAIIGGHEHDMRYEKVGKVQITKAHANARSAYVVKLKIKTKRDKVNTSTELRYLDEKIPLDSHTNVVIEKWTAIASRNFASIGFDPSKVLIKKSVPLDGRETETRFRSTNLTRLIVSAMEAAAPQPDVVLFNSGSIRIDDIIHPPMTQYDLIRALPFGGGIQQVEMRGNLLIKTLDQGMNNRGNGGFLLYNEAVKYDTSKNRWLLKETPIDPEQIYKVAMTDYLLTGRETNLAYLEPKNTDILSVYRYQPHIGHPMSDIRQAVIRYMEARGFELE
jgi:2',3'-cyclic-nucleotide 2'-phosphodiesterase (5'-nucleotidase family)